MSRYQKLRKTSIIVWVLSISTSQTQPLQGSKTKLDAMGEDTKNFIQKVGKMLFKETGEKRSTSFLLQQISIEI